MSHDAEFMKGRLTIEQDDVSIHQVALNCITILQKEEKKEKRNHQNNFMVEICVYVENA